MIKKLMTVFVIVLTVVSGCSAVSGSAHLPYTQTAVCDRITRSERYSFFQYAEDTDIVIPALEQNFVPQGIAYWHKRDWLILSGYFRPASKEASALLLAVNAATGGLVGAYTLADSRGRVMSGHFSGVAVTERDLFVADGYSMFRVPLYQIEKAGNSGTLRISQEYSLGIDGGSCNYSDGILWVCEHYQSADYPLRGNHVARNNDGSTYHAWMVGYRVTIRGELKPYCVFSVPDEIQGITVLRDGRIVLSCSYGRTNPSRIIVCEDPRQDTPDGYVTADGATVPLWFLDQTNGMKKLTAPPMSEGCCTVGDSIYLIFESGAYYYRAFQPDHTAIDPTDRIWKVCLP